MTVSPTVQASRFEAPWRSSTKGGGLAARHTASLRKWRAKALRAKALRAKAAARL